MAESENARFLPSRDGFGFANSWPEGPAVRLRTPIGELGIGNAARGLCGGMVFASLDYWHAGHRPPSSLPAPGSPLFRFIVRRLIRSWRIPVGVARYYYWMTVPDDDTPRRRGLWSRSVRRHWPRISAQLAAGEPVALGIVTVASPNPLQLGHNHQVLAYACQTDGTAVTLRIYDPNSGPADDVYIKFDAAAAGAGFTHTIDIGRPVRGFFVTPYSPLTPP
jgi:hypothetical protein